MAITTKKLSIYVVAGVLSTLVIIFAVFTSGIQLPTNSNQGQNQNYAGILTVAIKDAPVDVSQLMITVDGVEVQSQNNGWTNLPLVGDAKSTSFDLLALQDISKDLSTTLLPAGSYSKIRLHVLSATATFADGSTAELKVPSEKIDVIINFQIEEGKTTSVLIDMTANHVAISTSHNLRPVVKAIVTSPVSIQGTNAPATTPATPTETPTETPTIASSETQEPPTAPPTQQPQTAA